MGESPTRLLQSRPKMALSAIGLLAVGIGVSSAMWIEQKEPPQRGLASEPGSIKAAPSTLTPLKKPSLLPTYHRGDYFDYSVSEDADGESLQFNRRWKVDEVLGDRIVWKIGNNASETTSLNPLAPALNWDATEAGHGKRQIFSDPLALFPLSKGKSFSLKSLDSADSIAAENEWTCEVGDQEQLMVTAGSFRTWKIECKDQAGLSREVYQYADEIGFWVSRRSFFKRGDQTKERVFELVASNRLQR